MRVIGGAVVARRAEHNPREWRQPSIENIEAYLRPGQVDVNLFVVSEIRADIADGLKPDAFVAVERNLRRAVDALIIRNPEVKASVDESGVNLSLRLRGCRA